MMEALPPRGQWLRALRALENDRLVDRLSSIAHGLNIEQRRLPQTGLAMLEVREPNHGERFHLGELPLAIAEVLVVDCEGRESIGAAQAMDDREDVIVALAIADAVLAGGLQGSETVADLIREGWHKVRNEDRIRAGLLRRTTVDFGLLEEADDGD